jgi:ankyrin repeat protein
MHKKTFLTAVTIIFLVHPVAQLDSATHYSNRYVLPTLLTAGLLFGGAYAAYLYGKKTTPEVSPDMAPAISPDLLREAGNDISKVKDILGSVDPHAPDKNGRTPLIYAVTYALMPQQELLDTIQDLLVHKQVDANAQDTNGRNALMYIATKKPATNISAQDAELLLKIEKNIAQLLLKNKVDIDAQDSNGKTALMLAAERNNKELVNHLIEQGADPNIRSNSGMSALMYNAVTARDAEIMNLLINAGAHVDLQDQNGTTALMFAAANITSFPRLSTADPVINTLVESGGADISIKDTEGRTAIEHLPSKIKNARITRRKQYLKQQLDQQLMMRDLTNMEEM